MPKKFYINHVEYNEDSIIVYAEELMKSDQKWESDLGRFILEWMNEKTVVTVHTSGSTGIPKAISLSKKAMIESARLTASFFDLIPIANVLLALPTTFIAGKMVVVRCFVNGWNLITTQPKQNPIEGINEHIDFASFTPMQVSEMIASSRESFGKISKVLIGGAAISPQLEFELSQFKNELYATYGMTETITHVAVRKLNSDDDVFRALPGIAFEVNDSNCLVIKAPHIGDDSIVTNDVVNLTSSTSFQLLGRIDNVINSGGVKLFPEKIESVIGRDIQQNLFCWKLPDERLGEKLILYIEGKFSDVELLSSWIINWKSHLTSFEIPKEIFVVDQFERTPTDKIIRKNYNGEKIYG